MTQPNTPNPPRTPLPRRAPSRDMLGGPVLGVAVFLVVAVLLGWGLVSLLKSQLEGTVRDARAGAAQPDGLDNRFDPEAEYVLTTALLLGRSADGRTAVLYPDRDALPAHAPNRRYVPRLADVRADTGQDKYPDVIGVVEPGTRVRFTRLVEDAHNRQTRFLVHLALPDAPHGVEFATGMHLESAEQGDDGRRTVSPRGDLFTRVTPAETDAPADADSPPTEPIQSP